MPVRKQITRVKRINDRTISDLHELIRQGIPWNVDHKFRSEVGLAELRGLVTGHFFFTKLCEERGDKETKKELYDAVKDDLVPAHAHYRPGLRPWAWWQWDAPELRHAVGRYCIDAGHGDKCDGSHDTHPDLPEPVKTYFGTPSVGDGNIYEDEYAYLERLDLLLPEEKGIFKKYDSVINVYVQQGERGKCAPCWERARVIAAKIEFDLDSAMQQYEFWIPGDLYIPCEHWQNNGACGIFVDTD